MNNLVLGCMRVFCWAFSFRTGRHVVVVIWSRALDTLYTVGSRVHIVVESRNMRCPDGSAVEDSVHIGTTARPSTVEGRKLLKVVCNETLCSTRRMRWCWAKETTSE